MHRVESENDLSQNPLEYSVIHEYRRQNSNKQLRKSKSKTVLLRSKQNNVWIPDENVSECMKCGAEFTMWLRRHHCRGCMGVYCYECTPFRRVIPDTLKTETPETLRETVDRAIDQLSDSIGDGNKLLSGKKGRKKEQLAQRLCYECNDQVELLESLDDLIRVFSLVMPDLDTMNSMAGVCHMWNNMVQYFKGKLRNIQYKAVDADYTELERKLLWVNRKYWVGHSHYTIRMLSSLEYDSYYYRIHQHEQLLEFLQLVEEAQKPSYNCLNLMCTKNCSKALRPYHAIILADLCCRNSVCNQLNDFTLRILSRINQEEMSLYLPYLIDKLIYHRVDSKYSWGNFLINRAISDSEMAIEFYWNLVYKEKVTRHAIYRYYLNKLLNHVSKMSIRMINSSFELARILESIPRTSSGMADLIEVKDYFRKQNFKDLVIPFNVHLKIKNLVIHQVSVKNSYTAPIMLPFQCSTQKIDDNGRGREVTQVKRVLYKFEGVRTDYLVLKAIRLMKYLLWKYEKIELEIVDYHVCPLSENTGMIEVVPDCSTAYEIKEKMNFSIWNYIVENNPNQTVETLRQRFVKSCATYCVVTYLLGVGDRHLDNIMITKDGRLFHIDYGFILGADPKPISQPKIRITPDMVDALGGYKSVYYEEFLLLCNRIYQGLRGHLNLFICMLSMLTDTQEEYDHLVKLLTSRFMAGETQKTAVIQLESEIMRSSTQHNLGEKVVDFFHYHNKEKTLQDLVSGTANATGNVIKGASSLGKKAGGYLWSKNWFK